MPIETKQCNRCRKQFPSPSFLRHGKLTRLCIVCDRELRKIAARKRRKENPEKYRDRSLEQYRKNRKKYKEAEKLRTKEYRRLVLEHYSGTPPKCQCCGEKEELFLTIDHINNDGYKERKSISQSKTGNRSSSGSWLPKKIINDGFPNTFQILCFNCNCGKARNKGTCPHK